MYLLYQYFVANQLTYGKNFGTHYGGYANSTVDSIDQSF